MNLGCDNAIVKGTALDEFSRKYNVLTIDEVRDALQVSCKDLLSILSHTVPCVGCRRRYVLQSWSFILSIGTIVHVP